MRVPMILKRLTMLEERFSEAVGYRNSNGRFCHCRRKGVIFPGDPRLPLPDPWICDKCGKEILVRTIMPKSSPTRPFKMDDILENAENENIENR